jgi:hypothetical protein
MKATGLHIVDDKKVFFGNADDASIEYDEDGTNQLRFAGAEVIFESTLTASSAIVLSDDKKLYFGSGLDASIEYDENGTDELRFAGAAVTFEQNVSFDEDVTLGLDNSDVVTVAAQLTASDGLLIADDKKLYFGAGQDASFEYDENGNDVLLYSGASLRISDDTKIEFGAGGDASIEYDENGTDELRFAGAAVTFEQNVSFDEDVTLGLSSADVVTVPGQLTASHGLRVNTLPVIVASNQINGAAGQAINFDGSANVGIKNSMTVGGGSGDSGITLGSDGSLQVDGSLTQNNTAMFKGNVDFSGSSATAPDVTFYGDGGIGSNEFMRWDSSEANLRFLVGGAEIMTVGADANSDYAIDVATGANNINKIRAAGFVTYSDESLKSDVQTMNTALDTVMSLEGVEFTWKDSGERDFGFIAQEVQAVLPKAVHTAGDGVQGVDYSRLTSVLVEAVKAQQVQIEDLKNMITKLKK